MVVLLTSDVGASRKENGVRLSTPLDNTYGFVDNIKLLIKDQNLLLCVASSPNGGKVSAKFAKHTFESFNMSGIPFKMVVMLDATNAVETKKLAKEADLIFLMGGHPQTQMKLFNDIKLTEALKNCKGLIIGQSAGAINLAKNAYVSPESNEEINDERYYKGLGLTNISIDPHYKNDPQFDNDILLPDSKNQEFFAITDSSYIIDDGKTQTIHGEAYLFKDGVRKRTNNIKQVLNNRASAKSND